jgi:hypothetical protein
VALLGIGQDFLTDFSKLEKARGAGHDRAGGFGDPLLRHSRPKEQGRGAGRNHAWDVRSGSSRRWRCPMYRKGLCLPQPRLRLHLFTCR